MDVGDAIGLDNAAEACFDVVGGSAEVLGDVTLSSFSF